MDASVPSAAARLRSIRRTAAVPVAGLVLLLVAASAPAVVAESATVERGTETTPIVDTFYCQGWPDGTLIGTDVVDYQSVSRGDAFHVTGTDSATFRADGPAGMYAIGGSLDRFILDGGPGFVYNNVHHDWATVYGADGQFLWKADYRLVEGLKISPDGTVRVEFARVVFDNAPCPGG